MNKIWEIKSYRTNKNDEIFEKLLESKKGKYNFDKEIFLSADLKYLSDPYLLTEMDSAVARVKQAVKNNEKILVYGDYDVDGITSAALLYRFFKSAYDLKIDYFIPDRSKDGYGLSKTALDKIALKEIDLIITVDCGISAVKEAEFIKEKNVDLIITDHHKPSEELPQAAAIINHHLVKQNDYFAKNIAGVGTALKLCQALDKKIFMNLKSQLLVIAALGTVADVAPLRNENRIIVKNGLELIKESKVLGLNILIEKLDLNPEAISAGQIAFIIAPPLNAAGRIHNPKKALNLLITENKNEAKKIANTLIEINFKRQKQEKEILNEAEEKISKLNLENQKAIILADKNWHSGIIGIVASKLVDKYNLPVILFAINEKEKIAKGSARSISSLNIYSALKFCQDNLISYGGHKAAAGLSIKVNKIAKLKEQFVSYLKSNLKAEDYLFKNTADLNLKLSELNKELIKKIESFKPFGIANPAPKFLFRDLKAKSCYQIGKNNDHLKINFNNGIQGLAFNMGSKISEFKNSKIDLISQLEINHWQGKDNLQLKINDFRNSHAGLTPLIFKKKNYSIYDFKNTSSKKRQLQRLLKSKVIQKAAVYVNNKKEKNYYKNKSGLNYFFGSEYNFKADFSHLIFYSLPFSFEQFYEIVNSFFETNKTKNNKKIILLFGEKDIQYNTKIIKYLNEKEMAAAPESELDFKDSIRYNKLSGRLEKYKYFKKLISKNNLFELIDSVLNFEEDKNES